MVVVFVIDGQQRIPRRVDHKYKLYSALRFLLWESSKHLLKELSVDYCGDQLIIIYRT